MKGAEKSSDGIKAKESWPEELAGHHSGRLPGKRNRLKKSNEGPNGLSGSGQANDATDPDERPKVLFPDQPVNFSSSNVIDQR